jgi:hypothetical protein
MGEDEFKKLFSDAELNELQTAADAVAKQAATQPKKDGIWYVRDDSADQQNTLSLYAVNAGGKTIMWIAVNNTITLELDGIHFPGDATAHPIRIWNAKMDQWLDTEGFAIAYTHDDGTGRHIDGNTVRAYAMPRANKWVAHFYGI